MYQHETRALIDLVHRGTRTLAKGVQDEQLLLLTNAVLSIAVIHLRYPVVNLTVKQNDTVQRLIARLNERQAM